MFLGGLTGALVAAPRVAEAQQQAGKEYRVGVVLDGGPYAEALEGLRAALPELGLGEGKSSTSSTHAIQKVT